MGRRREQRTFVLLPVTVRGTDARGKPFELAAETCDISDFGARLRGLSSIASPGKEIEVECKDQKARYAIQWIGQSKTLSAKQVGIRLLEPGKYIWGIPSKGWAPDAFDTPEPSNGDRINSHPNGFEDPPDFPERRRFPRTSYRVETRITTEGSRAGLPGTITDISLGGCYIETIGPFPVNTLVGIDLKSGDNPSRLSGMVRSSQPGFGMGIEFTKMNAAEFETLQSLIPISPAAAVPSNPASRPAIPQPGNGASRAAKFSLVESNGNHSTTADSLDAALRVLFRKGLITRAEVAEEIESMKAAKVESLP